MRIAFVSDHASPLATVDAADDLGGVDAGGHLGGVDAGGHLGGADAGGQNVYVAETARQLAAMGHEVDVFTRHDGSSLPGWVEWSPGIRVYNVAAGPPRPVRKEDMPPHLSAFTEKVLEICRVERYDVVHAHFWMSAVVGLALKRVLGLPLVVTFHALGRVRRLHLGVADGFGDDRLESEDRVVAEADRIIAECPQDELDLIQMYEADPARLVMIPCGVSTEQFRPIDRRIARRMLGIDPDRHVVLSLGRLVPRKGVDTIIEAVHAVRHRHGLEALLLIVGGETNHPDPVATPEIGRLAALARSLGVEDLVTFVGRRGRHELAYFYSAADVFVTAPWYEPFGITPLEAMACGTPVVGTRVGGIKFTLRDGESGLLVPPRDADSIADRIAELASNPRLRSMLTETGLRRSRDLFSWAGVAGRLDEVYREVSGPKPPVEDPAIEVVEAGFDELMSVLAASRQAIAGPVAEAASIVADTVLGGNKVLVAGNGGSAAESQHFAAELVGRFRRPGRRGLPVVSLNADTAILTAWANDVSYDDVFARQVEALGSPGDLLVAFSTSGNSRNLVQACRRAHQIGLTTLGVLGGDGGKLRRSVDHHVIVPSGDTQRIQEVQSLVVHLVSELVEERVATADGAGLSTVASTAEGRAETWGEDEMVAAGRHG